MFAGKTRNNLSTKVILLVEFIILITGIIFCGISVYRSRVGVRKAIEQRMLDIANCASGSISGEAMNKINFDDKDGAEYKEIYRTLAVFRDNAELEYVYVIRETDDGSFIFLMDTDPVDPASYGEDAGYTRARAQASSGTAAVDETPYTDEWGKFYSAYSPVIDSSGRVVAIIAVDFSAAWFEGQLSAQTRSNVLSFITILIIALLVAAFLSMVTVRPFVRYQGQLLEEKVRAESENRAKSEFLARMSHEIRTPINAMLGLNEMILRNEDTAIRNPDDPSKVWDSVQNIGLYAEDIKKAGNDLMEIVNDILQFTGGEEEKTDVADRKSADHCELLTAPSARVLIVDDTKTNIIVMVSLLKDTQVQTDTASSGREAVEMAAKTKYDVILMDQRMPEMEGTEAMHRIRETEGGASSLTPIICVTADAVSGARERYLAEGFDDYMTKPVDGAALEKMVMSYLPKEKIERKSAEGSSNGNTGDSVEDGLAALRGAGIDTKTGLSFCGNNEALYRSIITEYAKSAKERCDNLEKNLNTKNWHDYGIYAHSLKSASRMIGAADLSQVAARLEKAANIQDDATIQSLHGSMMDRYAAVTAAINSVFPHEDGGEDEGDIIEFSPI